MKNIGPDFCLVQLTAAGVALAKGTPLRISNGRISVLFPADNAPVKVARYEWEMLLRKHAPLGELLVEIYVPVPTPATKENVKAEATDEAPKEKD